MRRATAADLFPEATGIRPLPPALAMLAASIVLLLGLSVRTPGAGSQVALLFRPDVTADQAIGSLAGMDARLVRAGGLGNVVVAYFERAVGWPELRAVGVLLPLDPALAGVCLWAS